MNDSKRVPMIIAAIAIGIGALAVAYFVGWLPSSRTTVATAPAAPAKAPPTPAAATVQSGVVLLPGETLVAPPDPITAPPPVPPPAAAPPARAPSPSPPKYTRPAPRVPAPELVAESPRPVPAPSIARVPAPSNAREERRPSAYERSTRSVCINCGVVTGIARGDYEWEVRVRFDDGTRQTLRYYDRPRVEIGDAVHLEDGRLVRD